MKAPSNDRDSQSPLLWYLRRFQSMPAAEIPHRIREVVLKKIGRLKIVARRDQHVAQDAFARRLPALPLNLDLGEGAITEPVRSQLARDIDFLCAGHLTLLNQLWPAGATYDWSLDPISGAHWRWREYTFDIPRRHDQGAGDVKFVWELSRLQHLQVLALGARLLGRGDARELCLRHLQAWLHDNPPYEGLGYASGIELASRVVSILAIVSFLGAETIVEPLRSDLWRALVCHGRWIARFPSLYSSANNHLVAESVALFVLGSLAPHLPEARGWKSTAWSRLEDSVAQLVLPDGVGAEQSPSYLAYTLEWLLLSRAVFVSETGEDQTSIDDGLRRGARFIASAADTHGNVPSIGDCDESVVLRTGLQESNYPASIVTSIARCCQFGEILHPAFNADLRGSLYCKNTLPPSSFDFRGAVFRDGGYTILRSNALEKELYLMFDHGPLGYAHTAAHGHADALSIWLHVGGRPVLADFGTYRYGADAGWRNWARSSAAHNTIEINGRSQSDMTGPFNWGKRARCRLLQSDPDGTTPHCAASHDGYLDRYGVTHQRKLVLDKGATVVITDSLAGRGSHSVSSRFHFSDEFEVRSVGDTELAVFDDQEQIGRILFDCPGLTCDLVRQEQEFVPGPGATSPAYNVLRPAWSVILSGEVDLPYTCQATFNFANSDSR